MLDDPSAGTDFDNYEYTNINLNFYNSVYEEVSYFSEQVQINPSSSNEECL